MKVTPPAFGLCSSVCPSSKTFLLHATGKADGVACPRTILKGLQGHSVPESSFVSYQRVATLELGFALTNDSVSVAHPGVGHLPGPL